ncbi:hypothetical protein M0R45_029420 [Rubus argutus]|uniref:RBR-type E3 ubiquitin transferase n=1 Tax=Rubus argutus TaxID=59490 RepID=A0AAW1WC57_RUBAR
MLRCPEPSCKAALGPELIQNVSLRTNKKAEYDEYKHYLLRTYVEHNMKKIRWCPAPDCNYCGNFAEENHRPLFCDTVKKWILKNKDDSQNAQWIMVNTKPCPECNRSIEKNQGCNHMTCTAPCFVEFCWYCLGPYRKGCRGNSFSYVNGKATDKSAWRGFTNVKRANCNSFLSAVMSDDPLVVQTKFTYFKTKLTSLKKVTGNYFNKLVSALEGGLSEISSKNQKRKGL